MEWLIQYKGWVFVGICVVVGSGIMRLFFKNKGEPNSQAVSGVHSRSHGRDNINGGAKHHDE